VCQLAKVEYYLKISKSADSVIHDVFWAYLGYSFTKDGSVHVFSRAKVLQWWNILLTLKHSRLSSHDY